MIILRCTNDNDVVVDIQVQDPIDLRLDISAIENATIGDVYGISSQEFSIVGSNEVNDFFGNLYNLGATPSVALQNSIPCQVLVDGGEVFKGKLYIKNIITDPEGYNTIYNVVVVNEVVDFKFELQDTLLAELDFSRFNHDFTFTNISASWEGNLATGSIVYPFVNYGSPEDDVDAPDYAFAVAVATGSNTIDNESSPLRMIDFKPAIRAKDVVDVIFSGSSYDYTSSFFNSDYFTDLYVLPTANDQLGPNNTSPISQSAWAYNASGSQTLTPNTLAKVDFDAEVVDNANNFSLVNDRYTADTPGNYTYQINVSYYITNNLIPSTTDRVGIQLRKNGGSLINTQQYIAPPSTGSAFLQGTVALAPSDYLEVELFWNTSSGLKNLIIRNEIGQPSYYPPGYLTYFQAKGPASLLGGNIDMAEQFPDDLKALDFLQGLIEKFNLVVESVPTTTNLISIEPYQDWINQGTEKDWTDKVDRSERFEITHPVTEMPRTIVFSDENDEDVLNEYTLKNKGRTFGSYTFTSDSDLAEGERRVGKVFAATPVTGIPNGRNFVVPHLCSITDNKDFRPIKFKPRLLYNFGPQVVPDTAWGITTAGGFDKGTIYVRDENATIQAVTRYNAMSTLTAIPVNYNTGQDLHFNNDLYTQYFQASANGKVKADAYRTYWATYINSLYDIDARKLTCNVYLKPTEIQNIRLNDKYFIDGAYYRINRINGANLSRRDTVEVELIKTFPLQLKFPRRRRPRVGLSTIDITLDYNSLSINGTGRYINLDTGATVDDFLTVQGAAVKDQFQVYNNAGTASVVWDYQQPVDNTNLFSQQTIGTNQVSVGASKASVIGSSNLVKESTDTSFVIGARNEVRENTNNVTVIGDSHIVDQESYNVQILGGVENYTSGSNNNLTIVGGTGSLAQNTDYSAIINSYNATLRDSDVTALINVHENEVVINGSGHAVIGLNLEGAGLDLLNYRNNSNWLGDTYLGEAIFQEAKTLNVGDGTSIQLYDTQYKHDSLFILNWNGFSPGTASIELPNYVNNDYEKIIYTFKANGTFDGTTYLEISGFGGTQLIEGSTTYAFSSSYDYVQLYAQSGSWLVLNAPGAGGGGGGTVGTLQQVTNLGATTTNTVYLQNGVEVTGSAKITGSLEVTGSIYFTEVIANPDTVVTPFATKAGFNSLLVGPIFNSSSITVVSGSVLKII